MRKTFLVCGGLMLLLCMATTAECTGQATDASTPAGRVQTADEHTINFEIAHAQTYVKASINGSGQLDFMLDSGTSFTLLKPVVAEKLGLDMTKQAVSVHVLGGDGNESVPLSSGARIELAGHSLIAQAIATMPLEYEEQVSGHKIDGLLGMDIFNHFVIRQDYVNRRLTVMTEDDGIKHSEFVVLPAQILLRGALIEMTLETLNGEKVKGRFLVDSGMGNELMLARWFVDEHPTLRSGALQQIREPGEQGGGVTVESGWLRNLTLGSFVVQTPKVIFHPVKSWGEGRISGVLGAGTLRMFDVIFDYPHGQLWLKPNSQFDQLRRAGIGLGLAADPIDFHRVLVGRVEPKSEAEKAGLRRGDIILAIGSTKGSLTLGGGIPSPSIYEVAAELENAPPGEKFFILASRDGKTKMIQVKKPSGVVAGAAANN